jgi:alkylhydroperoxidase family enzyme
MARITPITDERADEAAAAALAEVARNRGAVSAFARTLAHLPDAVWGFERMSAAIRNGPLTDELRELIVLRVAVVAGNEYEWRRHVPAALACGVTAEQVAAIGDWREAGCFDDTTRAVLALVDAQLRYDPVDDSTVAAVRDRLGEAGTVAVCLAMGWYLLCAAVMMPLDLAANDTMPAPDIPRPVATILSRSEP